MTKTVRSPHEALEQAMRATANRNRVKYAP
jgi:hypothetical protein